MLNDWKLQFILKEKNDISFKGHKTDGEVGYEVPDVKYDERTQTTLSC